MSRARSKKSPKGSAKPTKKRGCLSFGLALLVLGGISLGVVGLHYNSYTKRDLLDQGEEHMLVIPHETSWPRVVEIMARDRLIKHPWYFEVWARQQDLPKKVKSGTYKLRGPLDLPRLAKVIQRGGLVDEVALTIPEGYSIYRIADRVESLGLASRRAFLDTTKNKRLLALYDLEGKDSFEGYLFPDTYHFKQGVSTEEMVEKMHKRWKSKWAILMEEHPEALAAFKSKHGLEQHDVITLASLVERETSLPSERDLIARVFLNRLKKKMRLQTDPTCVYSEEAYREIPSPKRCKDKMSRYSTYVIKSLPPGPIANPGFDTMKATLTPSRAPGATKFLYFVAKRDGSGGHKFTRTFKAHKKAIKLHLKR